MAWDLGYIALILIPLPARVSLVAVAKLAAFA